MIRSGAVRRGTPAFLAAIVLLLVVAVRAQGATFTVNTTSDNAPALGECSGLAGDCSLRQAIDKSRPMVARMG
jgi:hypothetical protein